MIKQLTDHELIKLLDIKKSDKILDVGGSGKQQMLWWGVFPE
ncbi:unnamed protein product [marine sediment metagenome]|uniref:Uncharacterized protein n=1 Tax=marine sediment metagenome TaxID=412755 RepID=X1CKS8_9ZZZZ